MRDNFHNRRASPIKDRQRGMRIYGRSNYFVNGSVGLGKRFAPWNNESIPMEETMTQETSIAEELQPCRFCGKTPYTHDCEDMTNASGGLMAICLYTDCPIAGIGIDLKKWNASRPERETANRIKASGTTRGGDCIYCQNTRSIQVDDDPAKPCPRCQSPKEATRGGDEKTWPDVIKYLLGLGSLDGFTFPDFPDNGEVYKHRYWWRTALRDAWVNSQPPKESAPPITNDEASIFLANALIQHGCHAHLALSYGQALSAIATITRKESV